MISDDTLSGFLHRCRGQPDGFVATSEASPWRLGAVLMAGTEDGFVVIRKAPVQAGTYEFEGLYALPGGMVRTRTLPTGGVDLSAEDLTLQSLASRALQEAGLEVGSDRDMIDGGLGPIVTSYTAKGRQRFTLVLAFTARVSGSIVLKGRDPSVDEVRRMKAPMDWAQLAPANSLIIAHLLWNGFDEDERGRARDAIQSAAARCSLWAASSGLPAVPVPWSDDETLRTWIDGWSCIE